MKIIDLSVTISEEIKEPMATVAAQMELSVIVFEKNTTKPIGGLMPNWYPFF